MVLTTDQKKYIDHFKNECTQFDIRIKLDDQSYFAREQKNDEICANKPKTLDHKFTLQKKNNKKLRFFIFI